MDFDKIIDRRGTGSVKWDKMEALYGVSPEDGLSMWVADTDFRAPDPVQRALQAMVDHGVYGYGSDEAAYHDAITWWMAERHGWEVDPAHILTSHGLVNAVGLCLDALTARGDGIVLFTPIYHAFARVIRAAGRDLREVELAQDATGLYRLDMDAAEAALTGNEKMLIWCSPHNPGGRVWSRDELEQVAEFARRHDLILISDEIHHDLVFPGHTHIPMTALDDLSDRLIMLTAASKTFNIAGGETGNVIVADDTLRNRIKGRMAALGLSPNIFGMEMIRAAYSPEGAVWVDELVTYLDGNRRLFDRGIAEIPGLRSMALQSTYLAWVDFSGTGMPRMEFTSRVEQGARIAANHGPTFGTGGDSWLRFNLGTPRTRIAEAVSRLQQSFGDLQ
ncbi:MalY/PatB family protein [Palleronia caenipelagi]|uniref:cysteine-S-conjugate beta-lyase n=1 Tax=Palleronia caenipelagi TaxID=2489174 RepID=A0A547Q7K9_9RHOB|nr:MalY/PatB family protein [Palleronia caenipelagi]TRD22370.1 pyridoxal phosphate-dependent aminotransferase [Palleronia caenipelagi]